MDNEFSKYELYVSSDSIYCYKGTSVLKNKLGIKEITKLRKAETEISFLRLESLAINKMNGRFTINHLKSIHQYLFQDIYRFAGDFRKEQIGKSGTWFYPPQEIQKQLIGLFKEIKEFIILKTNDDDFFFDRLAYFMAEINAIHPFREGNGRTIREFIRQLALFKGYLLDWSKCDKDEIMTASILSFDDYVKLFDILKRCCEKM